MFRQPTPERFRWRKDGYTRYKLTNSISTEKVLLRPKEFRTVMAR